MPVYWNEFDLWPDDDNTPDDLDEIDDHPPYGDEDEPTTPRQPLMLDGKPLNIDTPTSDELPF